MRILVVNYEFPPVGGGGATANYYLAREMVKQGHAVRVVTSGFRGLPARADVEGIEVVRVPVWRQRQDFTKMHEMLQYVLSATPRAAVMGRSRGPEAWDIVQTFFAVPSGLVGWWPASCGHIPHVIRLGGGDLPGHEKRFSMAHRVLRPVVKCLLRGASARVVNSEGLRQRAQAIFPDLHFEVICNGVDVEIFRPGPKESERIPTVLFVSRLIERKGLHLLLPALGRLLNEGVEFRLLVVGDGPMRSQLEQQAEQLGLANTTDFLGLRPRSELPAIYRRADIFCLPSASEGMANVMLEALATGLPVVATDVPGSSELVQDGVNGFVVQAGHWEALVEPLRRLLSDTELRQRLGEAGRQHSENFAWSKMAGQYLKLYDGLNE
jgi:glycosyltransferase involved in cell wall biosynthesis